MIRINLINPSKLLYQHLMVEFKETEHISMFLQKSLNKESGHNLDEILKYFTLHKGCIKFVYNKGLYLAKRFKNIKIELHKRNFLIQNKQFKLDLFSYEYKNDWILSSNYIKIIMMRINEKLTLKESW